MRPVPPGLDLGLATLLADLSNETREAGLPTKPQRLFPTTSAAKPAASDWTYCLVFFTDLNALGVSNGTTWIRTDTGASV